MCHKCLVITPSLSHPNFPLRVHQPSSIITFACRLIMSCTSYLRRKSISNLFSVKIYLLSTPVIIGQYCIISYTSQCLKDTSSKTFKRIVAVFPSPLLSTAPKMLNVIKFTMIFRIIYHQVLCRVTDWLFNLATLRLEIWLYWKKTTSTTCYSTS